MDRETHLNEDHNLANMARALAAQGEHLGAGEFIWGATVHAVSAADPDHELQPADRFGNPHQVPNTNAAFLNAARRIIGNPLPEGQITRCLHNGQRRLHNHFYHLNLTATEVQYSADIGAAYVQQLLRVAERSV